ncbi:MAG: 4Fe-4S binding protein [Deltaproteobacteria bacterium]|jgi:pyruvate ferredoxin oxidoreductase delta subunit|nr:4Fe-4S binding protein [Deltaproteobacteria bacterium]
MEITIGAVVRGGTSLAYKTGSWRDQRPVLDMEECKVCGQCESVCPDSAVHVVEETYIINYDYCKGCGLCAYECPADAITMIREEK